MRVPVHRLGVPRVARSWGGAIGIGLFCVLVVVSILAPVLAPHSPTVPVGMPGSPPSQHTLLGTDILGRDVLSRLLYGGRTVLLLGTTSTVLAYAGGLTIGMCAGYTRSLIDPLLMRGVDVLLAFPALLLLLVLVSGLGTGIPVLIIGVVLVQIPAIARVMRTATLDICTRGYVDASVARGEHTGSILAKDVLPNIADVILADFGIRFGYSIILIASMNFLGLGLQPPTADWGLMISENRPIDGLNIWSVVAPAIMLALLTVSVNLVADAYIRTLGSGRHDVQRLLNRSDQRRALEGVGEHALDS